jgi:hypothetical protein
MMKDTGTGREGRVRAPAMRRPRQPVPRAHRVELMLADEEFEALTAAARRAGMARAAYAARAAVAAARGHGGGPVPREALGELMRAAVLVRRIGVNLNQAVAKLNATGQPSGDLVPYAAASTRLAARLHEAVEQVRRAALR